jgi:hypothetical protein
MGTLHEDLCTFMMISHWILLRMRNVSDRSCRQNKNRHCQFNKFFSERTAVCEVTVKYGTFALHAGKLTQEMHIQNM